MMLIWKAILITVNGIRTGDEGETGTSGTVGSSL